MRWTLVGVLSAVVLLVTASLRATGPSTAHASPPPLTHVCGSISADVTWTPAASPYQLDCNVLIPAGVTLAIQPGVVVYGTSDAALTVDGTLIAVGSPTAPITFTSAPTVAAWPGLDLHGATNSTALEYADVANAQTGIQGVPSNSNSGYSIAHVTFQGNGTGVEQDCLTQVGSLMLSNDTFDGNKTGLDLGTTCFPVTISAGFFGSNTVGVAATVETAVTIDDTTFSGNTMAASFTTDINIIDLSSGPLVMQHDNVVNNAAGLDLTVQSSSAPAPSLEYSNVYGNQRFAVHTTGTLDGSAGIYADASNNWWGTTDRSLIAQGVSDCSDPNNTGSPSVCVIIDPFLSNPDPEASAALAAVSTPTPTPLPPTIPPPTSTAVPTPTTIPESFAIDAVKVERAGAAPDYSLKGASLTSIRVRQLVRLSIYFRVQDMSGTRFETAFRITSDGKTVFFKQTHHTLADTLAGANSASRCPMHRIVPVSTRSRARFSLTADTSIGPLHSQRAHN